MECLTERTDAKRRNGYIAAATSKGKVTLATRPFSRGVDFSMPQEHTFVVIQTFLSSYASEERQLKGRTARQGRGGLYIQALCAVHLEGKFGFTEQDLKTLSTSTGEQTQRLLTSKQHEKTVSKMQGAAERRRAARVIEAETQRWGELLFKPNADISEKLKKLASWNASGSKVHYSVLLDISGSMYGESKRQMDRAFNRFRQELVQQEEKGSTTSVSVVLFNHEAQAELRGFWV
ncbi:unnamed protein product [Symbiodinium necroappetens]|uniref:Uncharacterized protein n=1 Tax=Symbiodinium necroappetens TaxID=1628268 RepID=A0A813B044_9DINO|nr:unnamed protein product [Symbiodinium necroappetens]